MSDVDAAAVCLLLLQDARQQLRVKYRSAGGKFPSCVPETTQRGEATFPALPSVVNCRCR
jgi:hypothetical protein